jgi:hypothetical protein
VASHLNSVGWFVSTDTIVQSTVEQAGSHKRAGPRYYSRVIAWNFQSRFDAIATRRPLLQLDW